MRTITRTLTWCVTLRHGNQGRRVHRETSARAAHTVATCGGGPGCQLTHNLELDTKTERTLASDWSRDRVLASDWPPSGADNDYMGCVASIDRLALFFTASEVLLSEVLLRKSLLPGQAELG